MITTNNINNTPDDWSNYFSQQVGNYAPSSIVAPAWRKPNKLKQSKGDKETVVIHKNCHKHTIRPWVTGDQHKPYGMSTPNPFNPFYDDDKPDWHRFCGGKKRKPMIFEEVIDENGNSMGSNGIIKVKPLGPDYKVDSKKEDTSNKSDEVDGEIIL